MNEFEELVKKRHVWVEANKINNFNLDSLLAGLYNDPSHFIYEILQNAEDAEAKEVKFELFEDRLDIYHDGIDFDFKDVEGITGIGISRKKDDLNAIGKFGVGFKSVFAITQTPFIYSGQYNLRIEDFVVPSVIKKGEQVKGTKIVLPFNHGLRSMEEIFNLVSKKLESIGLKTLLFLKNIEEIKWQTPANIGHYLKSKSHVEGFENIRKVTIVSNVLAEEYLVIERPIEIEGKGLKVEVAYKIGKNKENREIIVPEIESKLVVFFPTERPTYLNFLIQGPYKTTPNRENIPIDDEQNKTIVEETGILVAESLSVMKILGFLDKDFLGLLPINPENNKKDQIHAILYEKVKDKLSGEERLLPTIDGQYAKASNALLARGKELTTLLRKEDIKNLFFKEDWLNTDITPDQAKELRAYLIDEVGIIEIDFENFAGKITSEFLAKKSDEWMVDFYSSLLDQRAQWREKSSYSKAGILRTKPIIRLENNEHIAPFDDNGNIQVYLPTESKSEYKTVKHSLIESEKSLSFLEELGLTAPDIFSEIKEFILPKYRKENVNIEYKNYFEDLQKVLNAYNTIGQNIKEEFLSQFSDVNFVLSINPSLSQIAFKKPSEVYLNDLKLKAYFVDITTIYFVQEEVYKQFDHAIKILISFLQDIGVENKPKKIYINSKLSEEEKESLRKSSDLPRKSWEYVYDYDIEGIGKFLNNPSLNQSIALWDILTDVPASYFEGEYKWGNAASYPRIKKFTAQFVKTLRIKEWLYDKDGSLRSPFNLAISDLADDYVKNEPTIEILTKRLEFKPKIIDQLPYECKIKLELTKELSPEVLKLIVEEYNKKSTKESVEKNPESAEEKDWAPEVHPHEVDVNIEVEQLEIINSPDLKGQDGKLSTGSDSKEKKGSQEEKLTTNAKKQIGNWGEEYVFKALKSKFQENTIAQDTEFGFKVAYKNESVEVIWLNKSGNLGKGCDFIIKKNGAEVEYIEVKAKTGAGEEFIEITGTQWEFARKLFDQNEGEKYSISVVLNAGLPTAKIKYFSNPIKLWKDGKLYAHPVNFKL